MKNFIATLTLMASTSALAAPSLTVYNLPDYLDPQLLTVFTSQTGIEVDYHEYQNADELAAVLASGDSLDVMVTSQLQLPQLLSQQQLQPLPDTLLEGREAMINPILEGVVVKAGAHDYAIPYLWAAAGIVYEDSQVPQLMGSAPKHWISLFDADQLARTSDCGNGWENMPETVMELYSNAIGYHLKHMSDRRMSKLSKQLQAARPMILNLDRSQTVELLAKGDLCLSMAWSDEARSAAEQRSSLKFVIPDEGSVVELNSWMIAASSQQSEAAAKFIGFMMAPENVIQNSLYTHAYSTLTQQVTESSADEQQLAEVLPESGIQTRVHIQEQLDAEETERLHQYWQQVVDTAPF